MRTKLLWMTVAVTSLLTLSWPGTACAMEKRTPANLRGIDVSHWDGTINWRKVADSGVRFAYVKASGGASFTDSRFPYNVASARENGIAVGAYHYAHPTAPYRPQEAVEQATFFVNTMKHSLKGFGDLMPVLDFEDAGSLSNAQLVQWIRTFAATVTQQTHRQVMLYTSEDFIERHRQFSHRLKGMPLWVAYYDRLNGGRIPPDVGGWMQWSVWQYSDRGRVSGISSVVDVNAGPTNLSALRGNSPVPDQTPTAHAHAAQGSPHPAVQANNPDRTEPVNSHHQPVKDMLLGALGLIILSITLTVLVLLRRVRKGRYVPLIKLFHK